MKHWIDSVLASAVASWVRASSAHAGAVGWGCLAVTVALGAYVALELGVNSDNVQLMPAEMPSRVAHEEFSRHFPNLNDALLIVVDGQTPELARESADTMLAALRARPAQFTDAYIPGGGSFFERNGLLYRSADELDAFADQMARLQPVLAELERDSSVANFARMVKLALENVRETGEDAAQWSLVLDRVGRATVAVYEEVPYAVSWEEVLLQGSSVETAARRVIIAHPVLDFGSILAAGRAVSGVREIARDLGMTPDQGVTVRITGNPALNYEEMLGLAWDIGGASVFCFAIVAGILYLALRSLRLVIASLLTLLAGLVWTAGFATAAIGELNLISIAFAVLFIGLGVDFAIHLGMRYASLRQLDTSNADAILEAARDVGPSLAICTVTTAIGFFVFVPTQYRGVAELGLISGVGMFIILFLTLTLFPALLMRWLGIPEGQEVDESLHFDTSPFRILERRGAWVRGIALALGLAGLAALPFGHFDSNPINMRDPTTESVQAFNELLEDTHMSPWYVNLIRPDEASALALRARVEELESVRRATVLADYVPEDQEEKLEILDDVNLLLAAPAAPPEDTQPDVAEQIASLRALYQFLDNPWIDDEQGTLGDSMRALRDDLRVFLERIDTGEDPAAALDKFGDIVLSGFPDQLTRLRTALEATEITRESLPHEVVMRMLAEDGTTRIQVFPEENLQLGEAIDGFVDAVRAVDPQASGIAVNLVEFKRAVVSSFQQALLSAFCVITLLLLVLWRSVADTLVVMLPQLLAAILTGASVILFGMSFNFCNVLVIPLLFGIGVDSGIHLVHRSKEDPSGKEPLLGTTTARAVFYSALTTTVSFGSLALSSHRGVESLGVLLSVGMLVTVTSNLVVLPSLITLTRRGDAAPSS